MMEMASRASFPAVLFDGERETKLGDVFVFPSLKFEDFQSVISERIGLPPHQFAVYLVERKRRSVKIPVTGKTNFSAISSAKDCLFFVVRKRSRSQRRRKKREGDEIIRSSLVPPANVMLLRRDGSNIAINGNGFSISDLGRSGYYQKRVRELELEKQRYLLSMGSGPGPGPGIEGLNLAPRRPIDGAVVCQECLRGEQTGTGVGFHSCVYDAVTFGFRSPAGPIARPVKGSRGDTT
uniref:DUF7138 domain-containing protein n=1 Tax=Rhizophora mucronata TaxID=61149 RepID=A0A2P2JTD9_RHIMU